MTNDPTETETETLLREADLAALLKVQPVTCEKWRANNRGPAFIRIGRLVRYRLSDVQAWIARNRVDNAAA